MEKLNIGFVRRGFSASGGAEAYLRRLARGVVSAGHRATLFTNAQWPAEMWPAGEIERLAPTEPVEFADALAAMRPRQYCDVLVSLERVWSCDIFRAGDGVHRAWLTRRVAFESRWQQIARRWQSKHAAILRLEKALLSDGGARHVIANSAMVRDEIVAEYGYTAISVVPNGVRVSDFGPAPMKHEVARNQLALAPGQVAVLFLGSGWGRKGLRYAIDALEAVNDPRLQLLVVGRGPARKFKSRFVRFLGEANDVRPFLAAADIFILPTIYDPFSNACLEAMAAGLPVITTSSNGFSEIMTDRVHGSVVDRADNVSALADALWYWSDGGRRENAQQTILERATQFDISRSVTQTLDLIVQAALADATSGKMLKT
ncbi:MAG: glycosyltransferase family 4 protein [Verrucomicrobiota bacterium]|nr:glycosyltransferase family 4 protein [Verrucomicrobiota bacterium]